MISLSFLIIKNLQIVNCMYLYKNTLFSELIVSRFLTFLDTSTLRGLGVDGVQSGIIIGFGDLVPLFPRHACVMMVAPSPGI